MSTDHVVFNTKTVTFVCKHCGAEHPATPLPASIPMVVALSQAFLKLHRACPKPKETAR